MPEELAVVKTNARAARLASVWVQKAERGTRKKSHAYNESQCAFMNCFHVRAFFLFGACYDCEAGKTKGGGSCSPGC